MRVVAAKAGLYKPPKTTEVVPRCLEHAYEELNFSSAWDLARFIEHLDTSRHRSGKKQRNIRLPAWKTPERCRYVLAVPCGCTDSAGCRKCQGYKYGVRYIIGVSTRTRCEQHEAAPEPTSAK